MTLMDRLRCQTPECTEPRIRDGRWCKDCTNDILRETRRQKVSPWVQRMIERRGVAKSFR